MYNLKSLTINKTMKIALTIFAGLVLSLAIFGFGMYVGFRKANFSSHWGENYENLFGPTKNMRRASLPVSLGANDVQRMRGEEFMNDNSAGGSVIKVSDNIIYVKGDDNVEKNIFVSNSTLIREGRENISLTDIKTDDRVLVLGVPSSTGQIEAKFIRVFSKQ